MPRLVDSLLNRPSQTYSDSGAPARRPASATGGRYAASSSSSYGGGYAPRTGRSNSRQGGSRFAAPEPTILSGNMFSASGPLARGGSTHGRAPHELQNGFYYTPAASSSRRGKHRSYQPHYRPTSQSVMSDDDDARSQGSVGTNRSTRSLGNWIGSLSTGGSRMKSPSRTARYSYAAALEQQIAPPVPPLPDNYAGSRSPMPSPGSAYGPLPPHSHPSRTSFSPQPGGHPATYTPVSRPGSIVGAGTRTFSPAPSMDHVPGPGSAYGAPSTYAPTALSRASSANSRMGGAHTSGFHTPRLHSPDPYNQHPPAGPGYSQWEVPRVGSPHARGRDWNSFMASVAGTDVARTWERPQDSGIIAPPPPPSIAASARAWGAPHLPPRSTDQFTRGSTANGLARRQDHVDRIRAELAQEQAAAAQQPGTAVHQAAAEVVGVWSHHPGPTMSGAEPVGPPARDYSREERSQSPSAGSIAVSTPVSAPLSAAGTGTSSPHQAVPESGAAPVLEKHVSEHGSEDDSESEAEEEDEEDEDEDVEDEDVEDEDEDEDEEDFDASSSSEAHVPLHRSYIDDPRVMAAATVPSNSNSDEEAAVHHDEWSHVPRGALERVAEESEDGSSLPPSRPVSVFRAPMHTAAEARQPSGSRPAAAQPNKLQADVHVQPMEPNTVSAASREASLAAERQPVLLSAEPASAPAQAAAFVKEDVSIEDAGDVGPAPAPARQELEENEAVGEAELALPEGQAQGRAEAVNTGPALAEEGEDSDEDEGHITVPEQSHPMTSSLSASTTGTAITAPAPRGALSVAGESHAMTPGLSSSTTGTAVTATEGTRATASFESQRSSHVDDDRDAPAAPTSTLPGHLPQLALGSAFGAAGVLAAEFLSSNDALSRSGSGRGLPARNESAAAQVAPQAPVSDLPGSNASTPETLPKAAEQEEQLGLSSQGSIGQQFRDSTPRKDSSGLSARESAAAPAVVETKDEDESVLPPSETLSADAHMLRSDTIYMDAAMQPSETVFLEAYESRSITPTTEGEASHASALAASWVSAAAPPETPVLKTPEEVPVTPSGFGPAAMPQSAQPGSPLSPVAAVRSPSSSVSSNGATASLAQTSDHSLATITPAAQALAYGLSPSTPPAAAAQTKSTLGPTTSDKDVPDIAEPVPRRVHKRLSGGLSLGLGKLRFSKPAPESPASSSSLESAPNSPAKTTAAKGNTLYPGNGMGTPVAPATPSPKSATTSSPHPLPGSPAAEESQAPVSRVPGIPLKENEKGLTPPVDHETKTEPVSTTIPIAQLCVPHGDDDTISLAPSLNGYHDTREAPSPIPSSRAPSVFHDAPSEATESPPAAEAATISKENGDDLAKPAEQSEPPVLKQPQPKSIKQLEPKPETTAVETPKPKSQAQVADQTPKPEAKKVDKGMDRAKAEPVETALLESLPAAALVAALPSSVSILPTAVIDKAGSSTVPDRAAASAPAPTTAQPPALIAVVNPPATQAPVSGAPYVGGMASTALDDVLPAEALISALPSTTSPTSSTLPAASAPAPSLSVPAPLDSVQPKSPAVAPTSPTRPPRQRPVLGSPSASHAEVTSTPQTPISPLPLDSPGGAPLAFLSSDPDHLATPMTTPATSVLSSTQGEATKVKAPAQVATQPASDKRSSRSSELDKAVESKPAKVSKKKKGKSATLNDGSKGDRTIVLPGGITATRVAKSESRSRKKTGAKSALLQPLSRSAFLTTSQPSATAAAPQPDSPVAVADQQAERDLPPSASLLSNSTLGPTATVPSNTSTSAVGATSDALAPPGPPSSIRSGRSGRSARANVVEPALSESGSHRHRSKIGLSVGRPMEAIDEWQSSIPSPVEANRSSAPPPIRPAFMSSSITSRSRSSLDATSERTPDWVKLAPMGAPTAALLSEAGSTSTITRSPSVASSNGVPLKRLALTTQNLASVPGYAPSRYGAPSVMSSPAAPVGAAARRTAASERPRRMSQGEERLRSKTTMTTVAITSAIQPSRASSSAWSFKKRQTPTSAEEMPQPMIGLTAHTAPPRKVGSKEVLVAVIAVAVDGVDRGIVKERAQTPSGYGFVPGRSFCGRIAEVGWAVDGLRKGDIVFGLTDSKTSGALAEFLVIDHSLVAKAPEESLTTEQIAALPATGAMAYQVQQHYCEKLARGSRVLILNAHDGVGLLTMQACTRLGLIIVAQCPPTATDGYAIAQANGAKEVVVGEPLWAINSLHESSFDLVVDTIGGRRLYDASRRILAREGHFVTCYGDEGKSGQPGMRNHFHSLRRTFFKKDRKHIEYEWIGVDLGQDTHEALESMRRAALDGTICPRLSSILSLEDAHRAFDSPAATADSAATVVVRVAG